MHFSHVSDWISWKQDTVGGDWNEGRSGGGATLAVTQVSLHLFWGLGCGRGVFTFPGLESGG